MDYMARTPEQLGSILKSCRTRQGNTQEAVGAKVGIKQTTVSTFEANAARTRVDTLYKLLSALGLELVIRDRHADSSVPASKKREW